MNKLGYDIARSRDALLLRYSENWDHQVYLERFGESLVAFTDTFGDRPWAIIDDISNWPVKPPDEMKMCSELAQILVEKNLKHFAVFGSEYAVSKWMMEQIIPDQIEIGFFSSLEASKDWLKGKGYSVEFVSLNEVFSGS
ncbi:MAG: hypothetical protein Alis3KO_06920 [Aliiglaciecola sp.]